MELTLLSFNKQGVLKEALEDGLDMVNVFISGLGEDENVIQVDKDEPVEHVSKNVVYQDLEDGEGVGETEWHDEVLVVP